VLYELDCAVGQVAVTVGRGVAAALLFHVRTGGGLQLRVVSDEDEVTLLAFHLHRVRVERVMHSPRFSADPAELEVALHAPGVPHTFNVINSSTAMLRAATVLSLPYRILLHPKAPFVTTLSQPGQLFSV